MKIKITISPSQISISFLSALLDESSGKWTVDIDVLGGTGDYTYEWLVDGELISETESLEDVVDGLYTVLVTDSNGCEQSEEVLVRCITLIMIPGP